MRWIVPALAAGLLAAGCGGDAGDLMAIEVSPGATNTKPLEIVIESDGHARCNDRPEEQIPSDLLIDARELERDLGDLAEEGAFFEPTGAGRREYVVRIKAGAVRWSEGKRGIPRELPRTQLLTLRLDRLLCR